jgi:deazaflavin-dependent oxidoreductase (nitroreductase family)
VSPPQWLVKAFASKPGAWYFLNVANPIDKRLIPATKGRISLAPGQPICVIETVGAKSGQRRRTPLKYALDGDDLVLVASQGGAPKHPGWYHNLRKQPELKVWAPRGRSGDYVARVVEGPERERLWVKAASEYPGYDTYQVRAGDRQIPVVTLSPKS